MKKVILSTVMILLCCMTACAAKPTSESSVRSAEPSAQPTSETEATKITPTPEPTVPPTIAPTTKATDYVSYPTWDERKKEQLQSGIWIQYSPQAMLYEAYVFGDDGTAEKTKYVFERGTVEEFSGADSHVSIQYRLRGNQVLLTDEKSHQWTWYFTDDDDTLEFAYQDIMGGETYTISQKIRRHQSLPDYETAMNERKKRDE